MPESGVLSVGQEKSTGVGEDVESQPQAYVITSKFHSYIIMYITGLFYGYVLSQIV